MVNFDRLIYIYCLLQNVCLEFWGYLSMNVYDFIDTLLPDLTLFQVIIDVLADTAFADYLRSFTAFEFLFGSALLFIIVYNLGKWLVSIVPG